MSACDNVTPIRRGRPYVVGVPADDLKLVRRSMEIDNQWRVRAGLTPHALVGEYLYGVAISRIRDELGLGQQSIDLPAAGPSPAPTRWARFGAWLKKIGVLSGAKAVQS